MDRNPLRLFLFELSGKHLSDNNECNITHISNALLIAWQIHKRRPYLFNRLFDRSISKNDLIGSNIKQYINTTRRYTYSIFPHQPSVNTRHIPYRIVGINKQGVSIKEFVTLPSLSSPDTQTFFDRYAALVPSQYHDDFATLVLCLRVAFWKHGGSGGPTCLLSNGVEGVTKFSKRHNDKKRNRPTNTRFPPGELERLRLAAQKLQTDAEERQNQEWARSEAFKKEQQEKRQQDNMRILQERVEAERVEAERVEAERVEAKRRPYCRRSDADFTTYNFAQSFHEGDPIEVLAKALRRAGCQSVMTIANARMPIIKVTAQGVQCDMSMYRPMGVSNSKFIGAYRRISKAPHALHIAWGPEILSGSAGYLSSALALMLIVFLQDVTSPPILPRLQQQDRSRMEARNIDGYDCSFDHDRTHYRAFGNANTKQAAQLLMDFCQFYGYTFDYATQEVNSCLGVIKARSFDPPPRSEWDQRPKDWSLCVLDPFITGRNVAGNCRENNVAEIQKCFRDAFNAFGAGDVRTAFKVKKPSKKIIYSQLLR
ncbi:hypothetical protein BG015_001110 [Linnemannia schmuckeri]|uniref:Poly(A) RNA polymerase mitochondrial-like central palm domain-containing protein n=1 Tax=Linnemannia schmuckeri TaxID=64567 RepID=A0A9P5RQ75_9FUNG|nr:hypothetical protein BG015_001110 [Linnemannia schmuckeri]